MIIATKLDKISRNAVAKNVKIIRTKLQATKETVIIPFSAETKQGRDEIWALIEKSIAPEEEVVETPEEVEE